jgi:CHAD domain-containing protein
LEKTYRQSRKAMDRARKHPRSENFHEWRKRAKDHWYHVRLFENLWPQEIQDYEKKLKELEEYLGEDHNLVVLQERVLSTPSFYGREKDIQLFEALVDKYQKKLRDDAFAVGAEIYKDKPRQYARRIRKLGETPAAAA